MADHHEPGERQPLIGNGAATPAADHDVHDHKPVPRRVFWSVLIMCYMMTFCSQCYAAAFNTSLYETLEGLLCRDMHDGVLDPVADPRCKGQDVQAELSVLISIEASLETLPPILCGIVFGMIADVYGRKPVLILAVSGGLVYGLLDIAVCYFHEWVPIKFFWAVPLCYFFLGGAMVAAGIRWTMITDVLSKSQRSAFFLVSATAATTGQFVGAQLTSVLLPHGHYFTFFVTMGLALVELLLSCLIPETIHLREKSEDLEERTQSITKSLGVRIRTLRARSVASFKEMFLGRNVRLSLLLLSLPFTSVGKDVVGGIKQQYAVKRYHLSWSESARVISIQDATKIIVALIIMPLIVYGLGKARVLPITKDTWVARISVLLALAGATLGGAATQVGGFIVSVIFHGMSYCLEPTVRGLVVVMAHGAGTGSINSAIEVLSALANTVSGPIVAACFRLGMRLGGGWIGLPMFTAAALMLPGAIILYSLRFDDEVSEELEEEREGLL